MSGTRALDVLALVMAAGALAVIATGGVAPLTRPEDFVVASAVVAADRSLVRALPSERVHLLIDRGGRRLYSNEPDAR